MIVVVHDSEALVFEVLRWAVSDVRPTVIERFHYERRMLDGQDWKRQRLSDAQAAAVKYAAVQYMKERDQRRIVKGASTGVRSNG